MKQFLIIFCLGLVALTPTSSFSEASKNNQNNNIKIETIDKNLIEIKKHLNDLKRDSSVGQKYQAVFEKFQDKISHERSSHQTFVESTFSNFINYIQLIIGISGLLFIILTAYFGNNARKYIENKMNDKLAEAETDLQKEVSKFKAKLNNISGTLDAERSYLKQNITYIQTKDSAENLKIEIELLRNAGFSIKNVTKTDPSFYVLDDLKDTDILLVSASPSDDLVAIFESANNHINLSAKKVPIIIYCKGRVEKFNDLLEQHPWVIASNMPLTLVNSILTASKIKSLT